MTDMDDWEADEGRDEKLSRRDAADDVPQERSAEAINQAHEEKDA